MDEDSKDFDVAPTANNQILSSAYPPSIFLRPEMAIAFACIKCRKVPRKSMSTEDGDLLCESCSKSFEGETSFTRGVQNMINNLQIICITNNKKEVADEGMISITNNSSVSCEWKGKVKDWYIHYQQECEYAVIACEYCPQYTCIRKSMHIHLSDDCTHMVVGCPLKCNQLMKRHEQESHVQNDCPEFFLQCKNIGCNSQIKRQSIDIHMDSECDHRLVSCPFSKYGCNVSDNGKLPFCELKQHMMDNGMDHLNIKLDFVMNELKLGSSEIEMKQRNVPFEQVEKLKSSEIELKQENELLLQQISQMKIQHDNDAAKLDFVIDQVSKLEKSQIKMNEVNEVFAEKILTLEQNVKQQEIEREIERIEIQSNLEKCQRFSETIDELAQYTKNENLQLREYFISQMSRLKSIEIAVFKSTIESDFIQWNVTKIAPTSVNMIQFTNRNKDEVEILKPGMYKIYYRYYSTGYKYSTDGYIYLKRANEDVDDAKDDLRRNLPRIGYCGSRIYGTVMHNSFGSILEVVNLQRNDKIGCFCRTKKGTKESLCCLIIQRLGNIGN